MCTYTVTDENGATMTVEQRAYFQRRLESETVPARVVCDVDGEVGLLDLAHLRLSGVNEDEFLTVPVGESFSPSADYVNEAGGLYYDEEDLVAIDVRDEGRIGGRFRLRMLLFQSVRNPPKSSLRAPSTRLPLTSSLPRQRPSGQGGSLSALCH